MSRARNQAKSLILGILDETLPVLGHSVLKRRFVEVQKMSAKRGGRGGVIGSGVHSVRTVCLSWSNSPAGRIWKPRLNLDPRRRHSVSETRRRRLFRLLPKEWLPKNRLLAGHCDGCDITRRRVASLPSGGASARISPAISWRVLLCRSVIMKPSVVVNPVPLLP